MPLSNVGMMPLALLQITLTVNLPSGIFNIRAITNPPPSVKKDGYFALDLGRAIQTTPRTDEERGFRGHRAMASPGFDFPAVEE